MGDIDDHMRQESRVSPEDAEAVEAREQAAVELEKNLLEQEQRMERGTGVPIYEQADGAPADRLEGEDVITAGEGAGSGRAGQGADGTSSGIVSPGVGADPRETASGLEQRED